MVAGVGEVKISKETWRWAEEKKRRRTKVKRI